MIVYKKNGKELNLLLSKEEKTKIFHTQYNLNSEISNLLPLKKIWDIFFFVKMLIWSNVFLKLSNGREY